MIYPEYKIYTSAIVGGITIALGTAYGLKLKRITNSTVYLFMGGMTSETGIANEAIKFSIGQDLPIKFIIEINHKSVCTDTLPTWGIKNYSLKNSEKVEFTNMTCHGHTLEQERGFNFKWNTLMPSLNQWIG